MATEGGGKIKSKRQHGDSRPYARRQSLLGRMKDTVKDMLSPSWVVDLVNGVRKSPPKQNVPHGSEVQQQEPEGEIPVRRELNRMSAEDTILLSSGNLQPHTTGPPTAQPTAPPNPLAYSTPQQQYPAYRPPAPLPHHIMTNGDDKSDASDFSGATSCSSLMAHPDRKEYQGEILQMNDTHLRQIQQHLEMRNVSQSHSMQSADSTTSTSTVSDGSFLWSSSKRKVSKPQPPAKSQKPSFNISAFNTLSLTKQESSEVHQSPYYPGKTTFGGAASYRKSRIKQAPAPYEASPTRKQVQARPLNNSSLGGVTSSTAKRILDTLEKMSTPLSDAKKIPFDANTSDSALSMTPGVYRRRRTPNVTLSQSLSEGPPTTKLNVSTIASIATNRQPNTSMEVSAQNPLSSQKDVSSHGTEMPYQTSSASDRGGHRSGKMKRDRGAHYSSKNPDDEQMEAPDLPTGFVLPVSNIKLPAFDLAANSHKTMSRSHREPVELANASEPSTNKSPTFSFSSPIVKSSLTLPSSSPTNTAMFSFSSPIAIETTTSSFNSDSASSVPKMKAPTVNFNAGGKPSSENKLIPSAEDDTVPTPNGSIGSLQPASSLKTGSVMDILGMPSKEKSEVKITDTQISPLMKKTEGVASSQSSLIGNKLESSSSTPTANMSSKPVIQPGKEQATLPKSSLSTLFPRVEGDWTCDTCLLSNKADMTKCVACQTPKPGPKPSAPAVSASSKNASLSSLFKRTEGEWTCDTCLLTNKGDATKCVACQSLKPGPKPTSPVVSASTNASLSTLFKRTEGEWTCDTCLITNKSSEAKCVACQSPKPSPKPTVPVVSNSGSGTESLSALFKKPVGDWTCDICLVCNKADASKCIACQTPNPKASTSSQQTTTSGETSETSKSSPIGFKLTRKALGTWECDTCLVSNKPEASRCIACETPKPGAKPTTGFTNSAGFKFTPTGGFSFGSSSSSTSGTGESSGVSFGSAAGVSTEGTEGGKLPSSTFTVASGNKPVFGTTGEKDSTNESATATSTTPSSGFTFGAGTTTEVSKKKEGEPKAAFGGFSFGKPAASASADETSESKEKATTPSLGEFKFGNSVSQTSEKPKDEVPKPAATGFQFGQSAKSETKETNSSAPSNSFQFGQPAKTDKETSSSAPAMGFQFGQPAKTETKEPNPPAAAAASAGFQFGQTQATTNNQKAVPTGLSFQFGQPVSKESNAAGSRPLGAPTTGGFQLPTAPGDKKDGFSTTFQFGAKSAATDKKETLPNEPVPPFSATKSSDTSKSGFGFPSNKPEGIPSVAAGFQFGSSTATGAPASGGFVFSAGSGIKADEKAAPVPGFAFGSVNNSSKQTAAPKATDTPVAGGFNFMSPAPTTQSTSPSKRARDDMEGATDAKRPTFAFGDAAASKGGFKFGEAKQESATTVPTTFKFGQSNPGSSFGTNGSTINTTTGGFSGFNSANHQTTATNLFGSPNPGATTGPVFGNSSSTAAPAFGSTAPVPSFGAPTTTAPATGPINLTTPGSFNFGGNATSAPAGGLFQFTANANQGSTAASTGGAGAGFSFSQGGAPSQPSAPAAAPAPAFNSTPSFNFTGAPAAAQPGIFTFGASGSAPAGADNPFNATSAGNSGARRFKKAVRKLRK